VAITTEPETSPSQKNSLPVIAGGCVAAIIAGYVCSWAGFSQSTTTSVTALALGIPAAVKVRTDSRRGDSTADIARIRQGDLGPPAGLVVVLVAAVIVVLDTAWAEGAGGTLDVAHHVVSARKIETTAASSLMTTLVITESMIMGVSYVLLATYASHYLARRPFLWTATAVGVAFAVRQLVVLAFGPSLTTDLSAATGITLADLLANVTLIYLAILCACLAGAWLGTRDHDPFLTRKLARIESKVTTGTTTRDPHDLDDTGPESATAADSPDDTRSGPDGHQTLDPFIQLAKLTLLRDAGALTTDEFQAKKTEILSRI
jgi:hypothetical protein